MAIFRVALLLFSAGVVFTHAEHSDFEADHTILLQTQVQEHSSKPPDDVDHVAEYNLKEDLTCVSNKATVPTTPAKFVELETGPVVVHASGDPPGADLMRSVLNMMIALVIGAGAWRWQLQTQDTAGLAHHGEKVVESARVKMVTAVASGNIKSAAMVRADVPSVNQADIWGCTALHHAAASGSVVIATQLLKQGADVEAADANDETPLHFAARAGHASVCELLLVSGANMDALNAQELTPLVVAGHANAQAACRILFDHGAGAAGLADTELPPLVVSQVIQHIFEVGQ